MARITTSSSRTTKRARYFRFGRIPKRRCLAELLPHPLDKLKSVDGSPCVHIVEAELNRLKRFLALFVSLIFEFPTDEGLIKCEGRSAVGEPLLDEPFEG